MILGLMLCVLLGGAVVALPGASSSAPRRWVVVLLTAFAPLLMAAAVLHQAGDRLAIDRLSFEGKRLAFGPGEPVTLGGSSAESGHWEDLHVDALPPRSLWIEPAGEAEAGSLDGVALGDPVLHLAASSPGVRVGGRMLNHHALQDGDVLVLGSGDDAVRVTYHADALAVGGKKIDLPSAWKRLFRGGASVAYLPDLLAGEVEADILRRTRSALTRRGAFDPWHLLIRETTTTVERGEQRLAMADLFALPKRFDLAVQVVWGQQGRRYLRTLRRDELRLFETAAEIRFGAPQQVWVSSPEPAPSFALVTASTVDRRPFQLELDERSRRFEGMVASLARSGPKEPWTLEWLGDRRQVEPDHPIAIGEGANQLLIRLRPTFQQGRLLFDLALYGWLILVCFGDIVQRRPYLSTLLIPAGLLLGLRLLFAERAVASPPDFASSVYGEARIALWLVPGLVLLGWTVARCLRWTGRGAPPGLGRPVLGVVLCAVGGAVTTWEAGGPALLSVVPLAGLAALFLWLNLRGKVAPKSARSSAALPQPSPDRLLTPGGTSLVPTGETVLVDEPVSVGEPPLIASPHRPSAPPRAEWSLGGWAWLIAVGLGILAVRVVASTVGMPETLRLPVVELRVLWTVIQLPLCVAIFALGAQRAQAMGQDLLSGRHGRPEMALPWLRQILALGLFLASAYLAVALIVRDTGLIIAHGLAPVAGLSLLFAASAKPMSWQGKAKAAYLAGAALCLLPALGVVAANAQPGWVVSLVGWGTGVSGDEDTSDSQLIVDQAAALSSTRAQQLFRLYMLSDPEDLRDVGLQPSEQVAIHYETLKSYGREAGFGGGGYASSRLPQHMGATYFSDLVPMVFMLADFGLAGVLGVVVVYGGLLVLMLLRLGRPPWGAPDVISERGRWMSVLAAAAFALPSLYMILANLNLVLFTGKNCNLLSLNSVSDVLESSLLLALCAFGLGLEKEA